MSELDDRLTWFRDHILPHRASLRSRLRRVTVPGFDTDDLVAETLTRVFAVADWHPVTNGRAYLFRIARNFLIDAFRREAVVAFDRVADLDHLRADHSTEAGLSARDELRHVQRIVDGLPPQCRRVFVLRRVYERSMVSIADEMALSVSTVEKHLAKAIGLIADGMRCIEDDDLGRRKAYPARPTRDRGAGSVCDRSA